MALVKNNLKEHLDALKNQPGARLPRCAADLVLKPDAASCFQAASAAVTSPHFDFEKLDKLYTHASTPSLPSIVASTQPIAQLPQPSPQNSLKRPRSNDVEDEDLARETRPINIVPPRRAVAEDISFDEFDDPIVAPPSSRPPPPKVAPRVEPTFEGNDDDLLFTENDDDDGFGQDNDALLAAMQTPTGIICFLVLSPICGSQYALQAGG